MWCGLMIPTRISWNKLLIVKSMMMSSCAFVACLSAWFFTNVCVVFSKALLADRLLIVDILDMWQERVSLHSSVSVA